MKLHCERPIGRNGSQKAIWLLATGLMLSICMCRGAEEHSNAIRILIVTGMDHPAHNWKTSTVALRDVLAKDPRFWVEVLEDPYALENTDLTKFHVLFLHFNNWLKPDPSDKAKDNLEGFVKNGGGLFILHFACGAFPGWPKYSEIAGKIWDTKKTHDPRGLFKVDVISSADREITKDLQSFEADDELYFCLTGEKPVELLATATSKVTMKAEPMAFTHSFGKGRVFHTPLGHDAKAIRTPGTAELIRRGCAWSAGREPMAK